MTTVPCVLRDVLRPDAPLGPLDSEELLKRRNNSFETLYERGSEVHRIAGREDPTFIVGRKGAGKTAFLVGAARMANNNVVLLASEDVYAVVEKLRRRVTDDGTMIFADTLAHVWTVLLYHSAMMGCVGGNVVGHQRERRTIRAYLSRYGDPADVSAGALVARVGAALTTCILESPPGLTFLEMCESLEHDRGSYLGAKRALTAVLESPPPAPRVCVVVDNLEDLHVHIEDLRLILQGLFRATRGGSMSTDLPFRVRFAFPAELLGKLRDLTANPEKDFNSYLLIRWTAADLITLCGNRIRRYLDIYHPDAARRLRLPADHSAHDPGAGEAALRAVLPHGEIRTGLGVDEDPVAYIMRHTQLLPRHLIELLNSILRIPIATRADQLPRATASDVIAGIRAIEARIVDGVLTTFSHDYPGVATALGLLKNHLTNVLSCRELHRVYNRAAAVRSGLDFDEFLHAGLAVGALGIVDRHTSRYVIGRFAYTFADSLRAVEDSDTLCIHPLFMYRVFDRRHIARLREQKSLPVYPYGSDANHLDYDL